MWKVVIVDDDRYVLQGMKSAIPWEELQAECVGEAMNGAQGAEVIKEHKPHIVITDVYMPVMNGLDMIEKIREEGFEGKVVILSGYADFEYARQALRLGVDDYLSKPLTVQTIKDVLGNIINSIKNESFEKMENDKVRKHMMIYKSFAYNEWLKSLLMGTLQNESKEETLQFFAQEYINWDEESHQVICIETEKNINESDFNTSDWGLFRFAVQNIVQEIITNFKFNAEISQLNFYHTAILIHYDKDTNGEKIHNTLIEFCNEVNRCIKQYLKINAYVGIGNIKNNWTKISQSTIEAFEALEDKNTSQYIYEYNLKDDERSKSQEVISNFKSIRFYHKLADTVKYGQSEKTIEAVEEFLDELDEFNKAENLKNYNIKFLANELWTIISYGLYEIGVVTSEIYSDHQIQKELGTIYTIEELKLWIKDKVKGVFNDTKSNENIKHRQAVNFIIQYVEENYAQELTLNNLSKQVFISRNYLSDIFRNITGETFNNYLTKVRMQKARVLLMEGEYLIYEVAEMVGYKNVPYFSSLFKKHIGVNPSEVINKKLSDS